MKSIIQPSDLTTYEPMMIAYRRYLHQHPELSFQEFETSQYIVDQLNKLSHVEILRPTKTSVIAKFKGKKAGKIVGLRADIDALAITEMRQSDYQSQNEGVMHACGHDGHTAMLLTACHYFNDHFDAIEGEIWAIFQHAEELVPGGASEIMATNILDPLDFIYGHHLWSSIPTGQIDIKAGATSSNTDRYEAIIYGRGGHASQPENCIDPIVIGSMIVQKLQTIISRSISPLESGVISNTVFQAGDIESLNAIPDSVTLAGSVRSSSDEVRQILKSGIERMIQSTCDEYGATATIDYVIGNGAIINQPQETQFVQSIADRLDNLEVIHNPTVLAGEDFYIYADKIPACYTFIGTGSKEADSLYPHHHPKFTIDEASMMDGLSMFINVALNYSSSFKM